MNNIELNSNGINKLIKAHILSDNTMKEIGFSDFSEDTWYFSRRLKSPVEDITFNVSIPKDGSDIMIDVLDEDYLQPYDYQYFLSKNPRHEISLIVKEQVENLMTYLQDNGVLSGHEYGDYI